MKIALLHNPYRYQEFMENLDFVANNFGTLPPLGIMYVSSLLQEEGHETEIVDVKAEGLEFEEVVERLEDFDPDALGVMVIPFTAAITMDWAEKLEERLNVPVIAGNYAVLKYPEAVLSNDFIDYAVVGSAKETMPEILRAIDTGERKNLENIEGVGFREDGEVVVNPPEEHTENLDDLPYPDRGSVDASNYHSMASKGGNFTIMVTSYGCIYNCVFCDMGDFGYRERDPEDVVDEMEEIVEEHGIGEIDIFDRDFLINKERTKEICQEIVDRDLEVEWSCRTRVDQVDRETLSLMEDAGCRLILYGIESGNQEMLDRDHKGITKQQVREALSMTQEEGMETLGFFIIGHPGETEKEIEQTIEFAKELPLDYAQFFKMTGKPGTELYQEVKDDMGYDYFERLVAGEAEEMELPRPWTDMTSEELEEWVSYAYKEFYLRPSYIWRRMKKIRSLDEFKRNASVALKLMRSTL
ncbi:MAG: B12-binding domain-containing radical SAM protein [Candidatus Nanohaloarchaeota archaeon QJJ-7]|nr:B12-binding domain-containing radical SAM protein [Candidatus Nanohaloarchaeota archaeon QJJ-7]